MHPKNSFKINGLNFDNNKEFIEFLCYEAMSGHKKFNENQSKASICIEFDPDKGIITKSIETTPGGKPKFSIDSVEFSVYNSVGDSIDNSVVTSVGNFVDDVTKDYFKIK